MNTSLFCAQRAKVFIVKPVCCQNRWSRTFREDRYFGFVAHLFTDKFYHKILAYCGSKKKRTRCGGQYHKFRFSAKSPKWIVYHVINCEHRRPAYKPRMVVNYSGSMFILQTDAQVSNISFCCMNKEFACIASIKNSYSSKKMNLPKHYTFLF